jgi:hypothetical protein
MVYWILRCFKVSGGLRQHVQFDIITAVQVLLALAIPTVEICLKEGLDLERYIFEYSST